MTEAQDAFVAAWQERPELAHLAALADELRQQMRYPSTWAPVWRERLLRGDAVLREHGDQAAPDDLWQRWELLLLAYTTGLTAIETERRAMRKPRRRDYAPLPAETIMGMDTETTS